MVLENDLAMVKISDITKVGIEKAKIHTNVAEKKKPHKPWNMAMIKMSQFIAASCHLPPYNSTKVLLNEKAKKSHWVNKEQWERDRRREYR